MADLSSVAARHGFSLAAVQHLAAALQMGGGGLAQFNHPELGGAGQWMRGGLLQIGDMFNHSLKARVAAVLEELSSGAIAMPPSTAPGLWRDFPAQPGLPPKPGYGPPAFQGSQNDLHYSYYPTVARFVVVRQGQTQEFDTTGLVLHGVSAQQGQSLGSLLLHTSRGTLSLSQLPTVPPG